MAQVCAAEDQIAARGAQLLFVGNGNAMMARAFQAEYCPGASLAVDPERKAYDAFELVRGVAATLSPRTVLNALGALRGGHRQEGVQGDSWQQGGAFVIGSDGQVRYAYVSQRAGDHPEVEQLLGALDPTAA